MYTANTTLYRTLEHAPLAHLAAAANGEELEEEVEIEVEIEFEIHGSYYAGNHENPPEYPELEVTKVTTLNVDGKEVELRVLDNEWSAIDEACWEAAEAYNDDSYYC